MLALALTLSLFGPPSTPAVHLAPLLVLATPDLGAPDLTPRATTPSDRVTFGLDPHAGAARPSEVGLGAAGVLAANFASALSLGLALRGSGTNSEGFPKVSGGVALGWLALTALAIPAGAAFGAGLAANGEAGGSFGRSYAFALLAEFAGVAVCIPAFIANPWLGLALTTGWELGVIPWAASRGLHPEARPDGGSAAPGARGVPEVVAWRF